jgi:hypothetical protein
VTRRANARLAGITFLFYIAIGITQLVLGGTGSAEGTSARIGFMTQHAPQIRVNIVLSLLTCATALALATALYGLTREEDQDLALLAFGFRVGEGLVGAYGPMTTLGLLWLGATQIEGREALGGFLLQIESWGTTIAATLFAMGSTLFSWLLLRGRIVPVPLAWLGVFASVLLLGTLPLQLVGVLQGSVTQLLWIPMAAYEIPLALWLLIKGAAAPRRAAAL